MASAPPQRRPVLSVIGNGTPLAQDVEALCEELGRRAIEAGYRIASGGLGGVMAAVSRGAHQASSYREGDVLGILPTYDGDSANPHVDVVIPTGIGWARNLLVVASADVVVAVGGGSGTLSELAFAWQLQKPIIAMATAPGWSAKLGGSALDHRERPPVMAAQNAAEAIERALEVAPCVYSAP
ncbi:MAG: TIGR00725 family protein [Deltaproteobacteria bacterium]|jgi:uncharacterized protein (TIGR00725 family)|nr:TIGR00725 family protein [Deltaproteobacteria bacterium]MBW2535189.1 TIGR00725 family protein [Deltaproteobacteria bacterium]